MATFEIEDHVQNGFFKNPEFRFCVQSYVQKMLSTSIMILSQASTKEKSHANDETMRYVISLLEEQPVSRRKMQAVSDFVKNLFKTMQVQIYNNPQVKSWFQTRSTAEKHLKCLQSVMSQKLKHVFVLCAKRPSGTLEIYYLAKELYSYPDLSEMDAFIRGKMTLETILVPCQNQQSQRMRDKLKLLKNKIKMSEKICFSTFFTDLNATKIKNNTFIFGYYKEVERVKKQLLEITATSSITFTLQSLHRYQIDFLLRNRYQELRQIEHDYPEENIDLRSDLPEFSAPSNLQPEIESRIMELLSDTVSIELNSLKLDRNGAILAERHVAFIARRMHCTIETQLLHESTDCILPKACLSNIPVFQSLTKGSETSTESCDFVYRTSVADGILEIRQGDIGLQKVDVIIIPGMSNGFKEGLIDRAGSFDYDRIHTDSTEFTFIETNGGKLNCRRILFSNWSPLASTDNASHLQKSIKAFLTTTIDCVNKYEDIRSVAFAVSDSCSDEKQLAEQMVHVIKQQIYTRKLHMKMSFVFLPEQHSLFINFATLIKSIPESQALFEWQASVIKIKLITDEAEKLALCRKKIETYLDRCSISKISENKNGVFKEFDHETILTFYQYCINTHVLPQVQDSGRKIELTGFINNVKEVQQKLYVLMNLVREKASYKVPEKKTNTTSAMVSSRSSSVSYGEQMKLYNIMISYCRPDESRCQYLFKRLAHEGFAVWNEPANSDYLRDSSSEMDKSDCIILCISENTYENQSCEKDARCAFNTSKPVFLVKIRNDPLIGWQRDMFDGKLYFHMFGSKWHLDLEFDRLLIKILQYTKPGFISLLKNVSSRTKANEEEYSHLFELEKRREQHDKSTDQLMRKGYIDQEEMSMLVKQLEEIIADNDSGEYVIYRGFEDTIKRWLNRPKNHLKQNLPPFAVSGDINDALFPIPEYILKHLASESQSNADTSSLRVHSRDPLERAIIKRTTEHLSNRGRWHSPLTDANRTHGIFSQKLRSTITLPQIFNESHLYTDEDIERTSNLPCVPTPISFTGKKSKLEQSSSIRFGEENHEEVRIRKHSTARPPRLSQQERKACLERFAKKMLENATEFEKLCAIDASVSSNHHVLL